MNDDRTSNSAEQIFNDAVEIALPEERSAYLDQACGDDATLRAEVEQLLRHDSDAGSFLERPPQELEATVGSDALNIDASDAWQEVLAPSADPDCLGTLGPYQIVELLGRGGMGVVLRAHDPKLNRVVAVKLLAPELAANAMSVRRFLREAQAAAAVSHDHVVTIHAIDENARPPWIVMEYIDGQSLQQKIDTEGALDVKSSLRVGMQTAAGLAAAHRQGLVHRDVKPSNILLENGIERVKLTDFGLARAVDDIGVTRTGQITGTPQYMSPEQAQGQRVDHRTDLFSLGCVLYAMCTGRAAFRADSALAVMHRIVHDSPRPIREVNEDIPVWLCDIVGKLLAKNPDDRFDSAEEVEDLLERHLAHLQQPDSVPRPERIAEVAEPSSRKESPSRMEPRSPGLEQELYGVLITFALVGIACSLALAAAIYFEDAADEQSWYAAAQLVLVLTLTGTVIVFPTVMLAAIRLNRAILLGRRPGCLPLLASQVAVIPWNPLLLLTLPWAVRARRVLQRPDVQAVLGFDTAMGQAGWLRRLPIPAWIAMLLFLVVYVSAFKAGIGPTHALEANSIGLTFYVLATGFVLVWGVCALLTRRIRGSRLEASRQPPRRGQIVGAFAALIAVTGVFVWLWAGLSNPSDRERLRACFGGHGSITLILDDPTDRVEFNGAAQHVFPDSHVVIRPDRPGSYLVEVRKTAGRLRHSQSVIHDHQHHIVGIPRGTLVVVTGPIRGQ